ncbi:sialomucin core protein 24-like isoform X3 [Crassostrea angulata]|uniref:sialomucin core protein 24-like isoform X3 n=1 Tax=Magallana angulata TaxID=2784310 RepID=UPI0022B094A0|nr:sialomucin core protein 24-like isoform X3 [Crassostrea angulata]
MSRLHFGIVAVVLAVLSFTQCRDPKLNCTQYGENQTACCERPSCAFVNCTVNKTTGETHIGCHNLNNDTDTKDAAKICGVNVTAINKTNVCQAPDAKCEDLNQTECCGIQGFGLSCVFVNCTMKAQTNSSAMCMADKEISTKCEKDTNHTVCIPNNDTTTTAAPTTTTAAKTTPAAINTTAVPIKTTTPAPTTPAATNTTAVPVTTTIAPATTTKVTPKPAPSSKTGQHFDAASFIGGMILMGGLIVIIYFGLKFYRARRDRNYRTL